MVDRGLGSVLMRFQEAAGVFIVKMGFENPRGEVIWANHGGTKSLDDAENVHRFRDSCQHCRLWHSSQYALMKKGRFLVLPCINR